MDRNSLSRPIGKATATHANYCVKRSQNHPRRKQFFLYSWLLFSQFRRGPEAPAKSAKAIRDAADRRQTTHLNHGSISCHICQKTAKTTQPGHKTNFRLVTLRVTSRNTTSTLTKIRFFSTKITLHFYMRIRLNNRSWKFVLWHFKYHSEWSRDRS